MKNSLISSGAVLIVLVPLLLIGGTAFSFCVFVISILCLMEFINIKNEKKGLPNFIKFISYIIMTLLILTNANLEGINFSVDYRILVSLFMLYLLPTVLYHEPKKYSINDAFYMLGGVLFLGVSLSLFIVIRNKSLPLTIYLLLISIVTNSYAVLAGNLIGKKKILESICPRKTWAGLISGTFFGTFIPTVFFILFVPNSLPIYFIIFMSLFLSVLGQLGDLVFSAVKHYFKKDDFSNIIMGKEGILDKLDSTIFILMGFTYFLNLI